ncbi:hypothetical protein MKX03_021847 [Papaver bracteatum]|nr:hypothetical protein MKX03_021847 [Papaver bracteatum]
MASICKGKICPRILSVKSSWPELVGIDGDTAAATIKSENANIVSATVVLEGTFVQEDFRCTRVWIWVNGSGIVTRTPIVG